MGLHESLVGVDVPRRLGLRILDVDLCLYTNDEEIRERLSAYYEPYVTAPRPAAAIEVRLIQGEARPAGAFEDVPREDGRRVKEAVREVAGGRLILKRQTGVVMGLGATAAFAVGDLRTHLNQGINLVNACYARAVMTRGHVLFHASAVSRDGRAVMLAGPPGAGKSTAALHLVEQGFRFLSNDRVLASVGAEGVEALGYPKQPRVNPGTLLHHPRLHALLGEVDRKALAALERDELWRLERKADVDLDGIYGKGTVELRGVAHALIVLKWRHDRAGWRTRRLTATEAMADLPLFEKTLGVFDRHWPAARSRQADRLERYAAVLERVQVVEASGGVDFDALADLAASLLLT
jgi:HprK-related kinase B